MDWNGLDIYRRVKKFYDNMGGSFDAEFFNITSLLYTAVIMHSTIATPNTTVYSRLQSLIHTTKPPILS